LALPLVLVFSSCGGGGDDAIPGGDGELATLQLDASFPEGFSYLSRIRELADGRILAADPTAQVVLRLDLDAGVADTIGRQGAGPQEYDGPDRVLPLPGDSTLLVDLGNGRFIVIDPSGEFVSWTPMTESAENGEARTVHPRGLDDAGNIYADAPHYLEGPPDSTAMHSINRATGEETRVASRWHTEYVRRPRGSKRPMLVLYDDWAVGTDGRVAVVRANGYSVDWYFPDGTVVEGPPTETERYPVQEAEREAELEVMAATGIFSTVLTGEGGTQSMQMSRGIPASYFENRDGFEWPETLPVFRLSGTVVSPRGEAWVTRMMPAGVPGRVDVFSDQGIRLGFVELPTGAKVVGFGSGPDEIAYIARTDDMGLVWLERYNVIRGDARR